MVKKNLKNKDEQANVTNDKSDNIQNIIFNSLLFNEPKIPSKRQSAKYKIPNTEMKLVNNNIRLEIQLPDFIKDTLAISISTDSIIISCEAKKSGYYTNIKIEDQIIPQATISKIQGDVLYIDLLKKKEDKSWSGIEDLMKLAEDNKQTKDRLNKVQTHLKNVQTDYQDLLVKNRREIENKVDNFKISVIEKIIKNIDNFELALKSMDSKTDQKNDQIIKGLKLILTELKKLLTEEGVDEIPSVGFALDPTMHEVLNCSESEDEPENTILEEYQKGYKYKSKVIRPSRVRVAIIPKEKKSNE
jgi:molecular chaperone GrpE